MVPKSICISGSLTPELIAGQLASKIIALGSPFFLLPNTAEEPLADEDELQQALRSFAKIWQHAPTLPVLASLRLPPSASPYEAALRKRLALLPATYEFAIQQAVHQLHGICELITLTASGHGADVEELTRLCEDLYRHTLRGIAIGVAGLSYFERGLYLAPECEYLREKAVKLLGYLRKRGPTGCGTLLKNLHLKKLERDAILEGLSDEGLVGVEEGTATATSYLEFARGLYSRDEFPPVKNHREEEAAKAAATA